MGIEPTFSAWEADVLPLNYTRTLDSRQILAVPIVRRNNLFYELSCASLSPG